MAESKDSEYCEPARDCKNVAIHQEDDRNGFFICSTFKDKIPILPSTKLTAAMAVVLTWLDEAPDDKILVFTQFTGTAKMLGLMLQTLNITFVYYYGGLAPAQKARALEAMRDDSEMKVMVATLKSGGQSLNLTAANRVIIIDPWWNKTAEQQAFGRVVRIGQEKVTHLVNIKTKEAIDCRIYNLQNAKAKDVDRTLQDDGHTPLPVSQIELQKAFLRKKCEEEEKAARRPKAAKKATAKPASQDILNDLIGSGLSAQVRAQQLALLQVGIHGGVNLGSGLGLVEELQHQRSAPQGGNGVGNVLALDIGGAAVAGLANGKALANIGAGNETKTADKSSRTVGEDVAVQVGGDNDIVGFGLAEQLVDHGIDNLLLDGDGRVLGVGQRVLGRGAEQAIGLGKDVGLILGVLPHDDHINGPGRGHDRLDGANIGIEIEALAQRDNGRRIALDGVRGRADGAKERALALVAQDVDGGVGQRRSGLLKGLEAGLEMDKVELEPERGGQSLEDAAAGRDDFLADAVTGDEPCGRDGD
ncbi:hypothetical protein Trco_007084 [Trichoderma cornu-damae]|uniref:Helicase C-terminal domain-containing protein n=1 Tax=Trichoderma cornu-damae TaxID=654480 RepID=A0A9P8TUV3_9HYPO|nr:hypothetical protein Trco_007084 [Trichoderma cornu-damae]